MFLIIHELRNNNREAFLCSKQFKQRLFKFNTILAKTELMNRKEPTIQNEMFNSPSTLKIYNVYLLDRI